jgi:hypothetical protein
MSCSRRRTEMDLDAVFVGPAGEGLAAVDEANAVGEGEVAPDPLREHGEAVAEPDEKVDVDHEPADPRQEAAEVRFERPLDFGDGSQSADGGHVALIEVVEGFTRLMVEVSLDHARDVIAHLHGGLSDAGNLTAVLLNVGEVAADENFGMALRLRVLLTNTQPRLSVGTPRSLPSGDAWTPAAQRVTAAWKALIAGDDEALARHS